ncbi:MAG: M48 family metallopeptidase [bacterium]
MSDTARHQIGEREQAAIRQFSRWAFGITIALFITAVLLIVFADRWLVHISIESERRFVRPYVELAEMIGEAGDDQYAEGSQPRDAEGSHPQSAEGSQPRNAEGSHHQDIEAYLQGLVDELAAKLDWEEDIRLRIHYAENPTVNAFATLGGHLVFFEGLYELMPDENTLAMVLAHEIAHIHQRDPIISFGRHMIVGLIFSQTGGSANPELFYSLGSEMALNAYSREQEMAADSLALKILSEHYGSATGSLNLFDLLDRENVDGALPEIFSTHPDIEARKAALKRHIDKAHYGNSAARPIPERYRVKKDADL